MAYSLEEKGSLYSTDYRLYMKSGGRYISPFHDIPLYADRESCVFNMLVEIPRWTNAKMEIKLSEPLNPIMQDVKKGQVRFVKNCFPYHGYMWNYGTFPQTWEDPSHVDPDTRAEGDNDPVDVCEIGQRVWARGDVRQVKVLGTIALIDEGETDWKILAIDVTDPLATQMNGIQDIEKHMPGFLKATVQWFRVYKIPAGKPPNTFAFEGQAKDRDFAHRVVNETHEQWKKLVGKHCDPGPISCANTTVADSPYLKTAKEAGVLVKDQPPTAPQPLDPAIDKWFYIE
jgi:inorganic pyrophosphatase